MFKTSAQIVFTTGVALMLTACEQLPGTQKQQGAVIGGAAGAATGAVLAGSGNRGVGALLGGLLGAGGGYVIAANTDKIHNRDTAGATTASQNSQQSSLSGASEFRHDRRP